MVANERQKCIIRGGYYERILSTTANARFSRHTDRQTDKIIETAITGGSDLDLNLVCRSVWLLLSSS